MSSISAAQVKRGISIAQREGNLRWEWADLAYDIAPPGERGIDNGRDAALTALREQVAAKGDVPLSDLPSIDSLRDYRDGAAALPPAARAGVSVYAARDLLRFVPDKAQRLELVERLRSEHPKGLVTVDAVRVACDRQPTMPAGGPASRIRSDVERLSTEERGKLAVDEALANPDAFAEALSQQDMGPTRVGTAVNAAARRREERRDAERRTTDPDKQAEMDTMRKKFRFEDLLYGVKSDVEQIGLRTVFILRAVRKYDGEWTDETLAQLVEELDRAGSRLHMAREAIADLQGVDIDALIDQLTKEAHGA